MIKKDKVLFLLRSFNEGDYLLQTIDNIKKEGFEKILVVDDWSNDWTDEKLFLREDVYYIRHLINRGPGAALETGFEFVRKFEKKLEIDFVVCFDPDGQHNIKDVYRFLEAFEKKPDVEVVLGSRFLENSFDNMPFFRKLILKGASIFTFFISNVSITDPHNWFRALKISAIKKISLTLDWFEYASELIEQIVEKNIIFTEVPVHISYSDYSLSKWQKTLNAINIALKMIWLKFLKF